jgi:hypothetical protein
VIQLRLKSPTQLEQYFKKKHGLQSLQRTPNDNKEEHLGRALLNTQLWTTRDAMPPRQEPHIVTPPVYIPQANSIMPFAHPTTLNVSIAINGSSFGNEQQHVSSYASYDCTLQNDDA